MEAEGHADLGSGWPLRAPGTASRGRWQGGEPGALGRKSVPFCSILFRFLSGTWDVLGTDLGGFDTRMGRNGTHLGRNGTPVWALEAAARRGCLPGRGAAHGGIIARAFVLCQGL